MWGAGFMVQFLFRFWMAEPRPEMIVMSRFCRQNHGGGSKITRNLTFVI